MKRAATILIFLFTVTGFVFAYPLTSQQKLNLQSQRALVEGMNNFVEAMFEMEIILGRQEREIDYDTLERESRKVLHTIRQLRRMDDDRVYQQMLDELQVPVQNLKQLAKHKNPQARQYQDQIYKTCFKCHAAYRTRPVL